MLKYVYNSPNEPNAARLIESLRYLGYENISAVADLVDNCLDAEANKIILDIDKSNGDIRIVIADDGVGMDRATLDQSLRLGSMTEKNTMSDLGKFGMGLVTASLSLCTKITVISKQGSQFHTSCFDVARVKETNSFVKYLGEASKEEQEFFLGFLGDVASGTLVLLEHCDGVKNKNIKQFAVMLEKNLGRIHRHFLRAGKEMKINGQQVSVVDPLELDDPNTEMFSDEVYSIEFKRDGIKQVEQIRVRIALVPEHPSDGERQIAANQRTQGFYILRNNREIARAQTLDIFKRHNSLNRMRGEVFLSGELDIPVGIDFTKRNISFDQSLADQLTERLKGQVASIRNIESSKKKIEIAPEIEPVHQDAEKAIDQKAKLLIMPKPAPTAEPILDQRRCMFEAAKLGRTGQIYECREQGKTVVVVWNIEHPFYQRFVIDQKGDNDRMIAASDFLIFSMAVAELTLTTDDDSEVFDSFKSIISRNMRALLS